MAGTKIKLKDQLGRVVRVGGDATKGATVGRDLRWPDGSLVQESQVRNSTSQTGGATGGSTGGIASTVWRLIREVPANLQKLAALSGVGFTTRGVDGEWHQRSIAAGEGINVENTDGVEGNPEVSLAELPDAGGGALKKILRDDYGRIAGTSDPTTTDLLEGSNLYYTDARVDARIAAAGGIQVGEVLVADGISPPEMLTDEAETDFLYQG